MVEDVYKRQGHSLGQHLVGQMVVGDDEVYPQGGCKLGFLNGGNAVVHRDDELAALVVDGLDGVFGCLLYTSRCV